MDIRSAIEYFHLAFCSQLSSKIDRKLFCLKGGCNLRFYFQSYRYSEDIDFDVQIISVETLKKNVNQILENESFRYILKNNSGIEIADWSAPKQTPTTQRWKVQIKIKNQSQPIPTKIEFSHRNEKIIDGKVEQIPAHLIMSYKLQPIFLQHYPLVVAIEQKIGALIHRSETQARDVVDLKILKDQLPNNFKISINTDDKQKALNTLISISYDQFKSQVWPCLSLNYQNIYDNKDHWNTLQQEILDFLEILPVGKS